MASAVAILAAAAASAAGAASLGTITVLGLTLSTSALLSAGISIAGGLLQLAFQDSGSQGIPPQARSVVSNESSRARFIVLGGPVKTGGALLYFGVSDVPETENNYFRVQVYNCGPTNRIVTHLLDGEEAVLDAAGWVQEPERWQDRVRIITTDGDPDAVAIPEMVAAFPDWTAEHRARGLSTAMIQQKPVEPQDFTEVYPRQKLEYTPVIEGRNDIYDPRTGASGYSDNAALCALWFVLAPVSDGGLGLSLSDIKLSDWIAAADVCDEDVPLKAGGTEKRYRCAGMFSLDASPIKTIGDLVANFDGDLYLSPNGTIGVKVLTATSFVDSDLIFTADHIMEISLKRGAVLIDRKDEGVAVYTDPARSFGLTTTPVRVLRPGGERMKIDLDWCPSGTQAQRLLKRALEKSNPPASASVTTLPVGILATGGDFVGFDLPPLSMPSAIWAAQTHRISEDGLAVEMAVEGVTLPSWVPQTDEMDHPLPAPLSTTATSYAAPTGITVTTEQVAINGTTPGVRLAVRWTPGAPELRAEIAVSTAGEDGERRSSLVPASAGVLRTGVLQEGVQHTIVVTFISPAGKRFAAAPITATPLADSVAPPAPTLISAPASVGAGAAFTVSVRMPAVANLARVRLFVDGVQSDEAFSTGGTHILDAIAPAGSGTMSVTAKVLNVSSVESAASAAASISYS